MSLLDLEVFARDSNESNNPVPKQAVELSLSDQQSEDAILFQRSYLQRLDFESITLPTEHELKQPECQSWMHRIILMAKNDDIPGTLGYTRNDKRLFRYIAALLENFATEDPDTDTNDEFIEFLAERIAQPDPPEMEAAQQEIKVHYSLLYHDSLPFWNGTGITIYEQPKLLAAGAGNGYRTWEAALHFSNFIAKRAPWAKLFKNKTVLELGAGTGIISFTSLLNFRAKHVYATDGDPEVVQRLRGTLRRNFERVYERSMTCATYSWGNDLEAALSGPNGVREIDIVVAADVTYDLDLIEILADTLDMLMKRNPDVYIIIGATLRNTATIAEFLIVCEERDWIVRLNQDVAMPLREQEGYLYESDTSFYMILIVSKRGSGVSVVADGFSAYLSVSGQTVREVMNQLAQ